MGLNSRESPINFSEVRVLEAGLESDCLSRTKFIQRQSINQKDEMGNVLYKK